MTREEYETLHAFVANELEGMEAACGDMADSDSAVFLDPARRALAIVEKIPTMLASLDSMESERLS